VVAAANPASSVRPPLSQEPIAIRRIAGDPLPEELRVADRGHATLLGNLDELAKIVVRQALRREGTTGDPPQQESPDSFGMA
jgi:hypothetical protein